MANPATSKLSGKAALRSPYLSVTTPNGSSYGGSQTWFSDALIHDYGCGLIAAHDLFHYFNPTQETTFSTIETYQQSVRKLRPFFPILPRLGMNGLMLMIGLNLLFLLNRMPERAIWHIGYRNTGREIADLLHQDLPVILSIGNNFPLVWKKDRLSLYQKNAHGDFVKTSSVRAHYVTVTGIEHGWLRISSWGQEWYINWSEYRHFSRKKSCPLFSNICYIRR